VPTDRRLPDGARVVFAGCGTSFHAAQTGGWAMQSLEAVLSPPDADVMVCVSHEGSTPLTLEAARAFRGDVWLLTGKADSPLGELAAEVVVCTPELEQSWCHTASYTCAVAAIAALRGEDVSRLADAVEEALAFTEPVPSQAKILVAGAGRDWPTAQEAVLKLREGAWISAGAHQTEQLLHGHLAAIDETVRAYVHEGEGRAAERARDAAAALRELGCETTLVPTRHPVVDIVRFHLLTLALAEAKGIDPDRIHRDDRRIADAVARVQRIVVAFDDPASATLEHAADLAEALGAELIVATVTPSAESPEAKEAERVAQSKLDEARSRVAGRTVAAEFVTVSGQPGKAIVELADAREADLIVVGTRRKGFFERLVEGSVNQEVLRRASCDVLVVHR
jgi:nucleotide-binding universal stress UspA family protein